MLDLDLTERNGVWLAHQEENYHNAWLRVPGQQTNFLQISIRPDNYPGLTVSTVTLTDEQLAAHIHREFGGGLWFVRKANISVDINHEDGVVVGEADAA